MDRSPAGRIGSGQQAGTLARSIQFLGLTFAISISVYLSIIASDRGWIDVGVPTAVAALGVLGPGIAALLLTARHRGFEGIRHLVGALARARIGPRWWAATLFVPPALIGGTYAVYLALGGTVQVSTTLQLLVGAGSAAVVVFPFVVLLSIVLALGEEIGWRGYLLPVFQARFSALGASVLLGIAWFVWHVPLAYLPGEVNAGFPLPLWAVSIVSLAIIYTWLYNNTGGSLLAVTVFHAGLNTWGSLVALHPSETGETVSAAAIAGTEALFAVVLVFVFGPKTLTAGGSGFR